MRKIRIAALAVSVSMVLAVACQAPGRPHDGGIDRATWKSVKGPSHHAKESVRWYLEHTIGLLADNGDYVSTNIRVAILVGYELRRSAPHPGLSWEASLARIQRAHWHAVDDDWAGVAEALGSDPGVEVKKDTDLVWLETVDPTIPVDRTIERLFVNVIDNMNASGYTEEQVHCVQEEFAKCVPSMSVSAPAAWVGLWEAVLIAEKPPMDPANKTCDEPSTAAIICEVCPD